MFQIKKLILSDTSLLKWVHLKGVDKTGIRKVKKCVSFISNNDKNYGDKYLKIFYSRLYLYKIQIWEIIRLNTYDISYHWTKQN